MTYLAPLISVPCNSYIASSASRSSEKVKKAKVPFVSHRLRLPNFPKYSYKICKVEFKLQSKRGRSRSRSGERKLLVDLWCEHQDLVFQQKDSSFDLCDTLSTLSLAKFLFLLQLN